VTGDGVGEPVGPDLLPVEPEHVVGDPRAQAEQRGRRRDLGGRARRVDDELRAGPVAGLERPRAEQREGAVGVAQQRAARTEQGPVEVGVDAPEHPASVTGSDGRRP
jgi:hypothetical protein